MKKRGTHSAKTRRLWAVLGVFFWIALWCIAARFVGKEVLLPSPARVAVRLAELCRTALGLAWKAGVAAEVLCTPARTIGKNLYDAKIYIETVDVFAWTAVIVLLSLCFEALLRLAFDKMAGGGKTNEHTD